ncbi:FK506-binding protein 15-like [Oopsacas minuta]|uniref:peptidylprolyl isomerase n=1 Tax=Oopsacas minuta TaxID=111878 RepID=A0AAV7K468_9METZ|nr:FK506-binding protein 15-like [Oopsacas minuta]
MSKAILSLSSDEDADIVLAEDRKGLANLFGNEKMSATGQKPSLHYTAPKQPKPDKNRSVSKDAAQSVVIAVPIVAQQYIDGQYVNKGRVSLAILGNPVSKEYTLIIYKTQTDRRLSLRIEATLNFNVKENNYVNFYDDTRQAWAVKFDSSKDLYDLAFAIALAKANMTGLKTLLLQNLLIGEGQAVTTGDTVGVLYSGWLFTNGTIEKDKPFDSNVRSDKIFKVKLGEKAVIQGWDQGMVGMKKGGKKLILIPSKLAYGDKGVKGRIPPNASLVFEVELVKVKFLVKDAENRDMPMLPSMDDMDSNVNVRERTASFEEQTDVPDSSSKEAILKRLVKVAQPVLNQKLTHESYPSAESRGHPSEGSGRSTPVSVSSNPGQNSAHYAAPYEQPQHSSEQYYPHTNPHIQNAPYAHQLPFPPSQPPIYPPSQTSIYPTPSTALAPLSYSNQLQYPGHQSLLAAQAGLTTGATILQPQSVQNAPVQGVGVGEYSQLMADTKVELGKMSLRLDEIGKKVDSIHDNNARSLVPVQQETQRGGLLDSGVLLHSINKIVDENTHLKQEVVDRDNRMEGLNQRINQLLQSNQRYVEQSQQLLEQRSDSMHSMASNQQSRLSQIEVEKNELVVKFEEAKRNLDQKNLDLTEYKSESDDIKRKFENVMQKMTLAKEKFREKESEIEDLRTDCEQAKRESDKAKSSHNKLTNEIDDLTTTLEELRDKLKHDRTLKIKLDSKVTGYEDEINELKEENEQLQRTVEDRKRKFQMEKQKLQDTPQQC